VNVNPGPGIFPVPGYLLEPRKPATLAALVEKRHRVRGAARGQCEVSGLSAFNVIAWFVAGETEPAMVRRNRYWPPEQVRDLRRVEKVEIR